MEILKIESLRKIVIILFLSAVKLLIAQPYSSNSGSFQVDQKEGCAPLTINITEVGFTGHCTCTYNVGTTPISNTHTFTQPGTYVITGNAQTGANPSTDQITVTVNANTQPDFEISSCNGNKVSIKVTTAQFDSYLVDFDNDLTDDATILSGGTQSANFSYGSSGAKTITVRGKDNNASDNCSKKQQAFTAIPSLVASTINTLTVNDGASVSLNYTPTANYQYKAQVATNSASSFQPFQTINSATAAPQNIGLNGLATDDNYYCFRINSYDPCVNSSVNSNIICSANFDVSATSNVDHLSWVTSATGVSNYTVMRDGAPLQTVNPMSFDDTNITCNTDYDYQIVTNYSNGSTSTSLSKSLTAFSSRVPDAIEDGSAVVGDNSVDLTWFQPLGFPSTSFTIFRNQNGSAFSSIGTSLLNQYTDNAYTTEANYCYQISYVDACANTSPLSSAICPIKLSGTVNTQNQIQLDWSTFEGWKHGVGHFVVEKFDAQGTLIKSTNTLVSDLADNAEDPDNQIVSYRVTAKPRDAWLNESVSNTITIKRQARLVFPTAFTPNHDHLNDKFSVGGFYVESMKLQVFDRWGTLLFSTDNNEPWDGTYNGRLMPESTYVWKAFITDKAGDKFSQTGSVALLNRGK